MALQLRINESTAEASPGESVFECADRLGVRVPTSCHKNGKCRECLVEVVAGMEHLSPRTDEEKHLTGNFRLSCRARVLGAEGTISCHTLRRGAMRVEAEAINLPALPGHSQLDPTVTRVGRGIFLDGVRIDDSEGPIHGMAIDIGTTTCAARLFDLETGKRIASAEFENPQRFGGSDVMARIRYDTDNKGHLLQRTLLGYLSHTILELPVDPLSIHEIVVAGNSTMRDLLFGLSVYSIGQRPYRSITQQEMMEGKRSTTSLSARARTLRLPVNPEARVFGLPILHGHIGADAAACMLAIDLAHEARTVMLMDIGTNTELILKTGGRILVASCPAGPAFEGGAITCGMPALEGAIESIRLDSDGEPHFRVIGGGSPRGICGSGLVELLSELSRTGRMDPLGRFVDGSDAFWVDTQHGIRLTENDISELAQAKGANVAGLKILLSRGGIELPEIERFYVAGGFGRHMNVEAASRIGLIPDLRSERIVKIGNASLEGASIALLSKSRREELERLARTVEHVELETDPGFFDHFVSGCQLSPVDSSSTGSLE